MAIDNAELLNNDKAELFDKLTTKAKTQNMSVVKSFFDDYYGLSSYYSSGHPLNISGTHISVSHVASKMSRIIDYRQISNYNEVGDAIDEIADAHMTEHQDGSFAKVTFRGIELNDTIVKEIEREANHYFGLFNFEDNIFEYARRLIVEGELCWENIVARDDQEEGIIDVRFLPAETYEFAYDTKERRKTGIVVTSDSPLSDVSGYSLKDQNGIGYQGSNGITQNLNCYAQISSGKYVYLPFEQVTYINSGVYDKTGLVVYPAIERARRAYNQLQLVEDAMLIYRLVRAPVRSVFTVDCGKMPQHKAEEHVRKIAQAFTSKKMYDPATGSIHGSYDPINMLENLWIPKTAESSGVSIGTVGGEANFGNLEDINYFLRKLYRSLKVPPSRFISGSTGEPGNNTWQHTDEITYEEYRFAKFINRSLACFSRGLKEGLISHLKFTGVWQRANLQPQNICVSIEPPVELEIYKNQKLAAQRIETYKSYAETEGISKEISQEKILGWSKTEIQENRKAYERELLRDALFALKLDRLKSNPETAILKPNAKPETSEEPEVGEDFDEDRREDDEELMAKAREDFDSTEVEETGTVDENGTQHGINLPPPNPTVED